MAIFLSLSALGQTTTATTASMPSPVSEAIRERVDHLRYEREHDARDHQVRGANIVAADGVARFYEADQFQPRWQDPARLDQLIAAIADLRDGFELAERDFELRREGDVLGFAQSGLPGLRVASLTRRDHQQLAIRARHHAEAMLDARAEHHGADRILLQVQRQSEQVAREFDHFTVHHVG